MKLKLIDPLYHDNAKTMEMKNIKKKNCNEFNNTFISENRDNLTLNLIKHKRVCIGKSFDACPMQTNSKNLEGFLVT